MPDVTVPRVHHRFPLICVLTGERDEVESVDLIITRRWGSVWSLLLPEGVIGSMMEGLIEQYPIKLPMARRAFQSWQSARRLVTCAVYLGLIIEVLSAMILRERLAWGLDDPWDAVAWVMLVAGFVGPFVAFALLLWNKQPWLVQGRGLFVDVWIPSEEAAAVIWAHVEPLAERANAIGAGRGS
jgi:hypothetical protein